MTPLIPTTFGAAKSLLEQYRLRMLVAPHDYSSVFNVLNSESTSAIGEVNPLIKCLMDQLTVLK
jgi:hypothetical protein